MFSIFANTRSRDPIHVDVTWPELIDFLRQWSAELRDPTADEKLLRTPMISPAIYAAGATRSNANVQRLAPWTGVDVDDAGLTVDDAVSIMEEAECDYAIYTTTKSRPDAQRLRILFPLSRDVTPAEAPTLWRGVHDFLSGVGDVQTKDISRIYAVPAAWIGSSPQFVATNTGRVMDVDRLIAMAPPVEAPAAIDPKTLKRALKALDGAGRPLSGSIYDSKAVSSAFIDDYLALQRGEHHTGLFRFMARVASRALFLGLAVTVDDLVTYARQVDAVSPFPRDPSRWRRIATEAASALRWAQNQYRQQ